MRLIEVLKGFETMLDGQAIDGEMEIAGLTCDSRVVRPGYIFAALPGVNHDGCDFITAAIEGGATCILGPVGTVSSVPVLQDNNPRRSFALMAANFYSGQPQNIVAITGTNGKTSAASFLRQIWEHLGMKGASLGTLGIHGAGFDEPGTLTTPDPVQLHEILNRLADAGVENLALEASSHGLAQFRLDGVRITASGLTNITRDHLDYHGTMQEYRAAKLHLFNTLTDEGGAVVVNADASDAQDVVTIAHERGLDVLTYGRNGDDIRVLFQKSVGEGQHVMLMVDGESYDIVVPLAGKFQVDNALCALGLALASGADAVLAIAALTHLEGVPGRMQRVGSVNGADLFVDYAHTPDALENVLKALRPHTRGKLYVVFGCGGDRDPGKRPLMGQIAAQFADQIIVTDDNPRYEEAAQIRAQILAAVPKAVEIGDRHEAILHAVFALAGGDVLVVAGKGHEQGQYIGENSLPFDDVAEIKTAIVEAKA